MNTNSQTKNKGGKTGKITHGSIFSGIGGFDLAAEWIGWKNAFHCEVNDFCLKVLKYHFKDAKTYTDIKTTDFREWRGKIDVLSGGFPCQPFSVAGKRKGSDDDRYLWPEMLRAISEIRPTWVIGENVAGLLTMVQPGSEVEVEHQASLFEENNKETILEQRFVVETICSDIERLGYSIQPIIIPACAVGAPHRRDRVWFIANCTNTGAEGMQQTWKDSIHAVEIVADTNGYGYLSCGTCEESERYRCRNDGESKKWKQSSEWLNGFHGFPRDASYSDSDRRNRIGGNRRERHNHTDTDGEDKESQPQRERLQSEFSENGSLTTDTESKQIERHELKQSRHSEQEQRKLGRNCRKNHTKYAIPDWQVFPTQSPVCSRDDGLSLRLDTITFSKWREESIKAYGNAIVPQVAHKIFKAIQEIYYKQ